ncbi:MAG: hypothetical protein JXB49_20300 [Bacteroidales bacterium]|nr:hypothetical protein [Bacteroidales bacterium]
MERDEQGKEFIPVFIKSRIYIDFSDISMFESEYEKLLRNIFDKPLFKRPVIGTPPPFITEEVIVSSPTVNKLRLLKNAMISQRSYTANLIDEYLDLFSNEIKKQIVDPNDIHEEVDEYILKRIELLKPAKDEFLDFIYSSISYNSFNESTIHRFFEDSLEFMVNHESSFHSSSELGYMAFDHIKFWFYEIYISICTILLKREMFSSLSYLINTNYVVQVNRNNDVNSLGFFNFCNSIATLNSFRIRRLGLNQINVTAELLSRRINSQYFTLDEIKETDLILYYVSIISAKYENHSRIWFPYMSIFRIHNSKILNRLKSKRFFESFKIVLNIKDIKELGERLEYVKKFELDRVDRFYYSLPYIESIIKISEIGILN